MKRIATALILALGAAIFAPRLTAQTDNTLYVKQFPGPDVATKTANAMRACNQNTAVPCVLVIDPSLATYQTGTMPALCSQCTLYDYRTPGVTPNLPGLSSDGAKGINVVGAVSAQTTNTGQLNGKFEIDGTTWTSVASALSACNSGSYVSCVIDDRGGKGSRSLGVLAPSKPTTILLGPFADYTFTSLTVSSNLHLEGSTAGTNTLSASGVGTTLQCASGTTYCIVEPQGNNLAVQHMSIKHVMFVGATGNTNQNGLYFDCGNYTNSGVWYSQFEDDVFIGFMGDSVHLTCPGTGQSAIQFSVFTDVEALRPSGASGSALYLGGAVGNNQWIGGQYDSGVCTDTTAVPNVYIGAWQGGTQNVYSQTFVGTTVQCGSLLMEIAGANNIQFYHLHSEGQSGVTNGVKFVLGGSQNNNILFSDSYFAANIGYGTGGYLFDKSNGGSNLSVVVRDSTFGCPTNLVNDTNSPGTNHTESFVFEGSSPGSGTNCTVTSNVVAQLAAAATLTVPANTRTAMITGTTTISNIQTTVLPGNSLALVSQQNGVNYASGGNINLNGASTLTTDSGETATFTRDDVTGMFNLTSFGKQKNRVMLSSFTESDTGVANDNSVQLTLNTTYGQCAIFRTYTGTAGQYWPSMLCGVGNGGGELRMYTSPASAKGSETWTLVQAAGPNGMAVGGGYAITNSGVTCTMAAGTTCTATVPSGSAHCTATVQGTTPITAACSVSGTTATITAASANSATWLAVATR